MEKSHLTQDQAPQAQQLELKNKNLDQIKVEIGP